MYLIRGFFLLFEAVDMVRLYTPNERSKHKQIIDLSFVKREMTLLF